MISFDLFTGCVKPFFRHVALDRSMVLNDLFLALRAFVNLMKNQFFPDHAEYPCST